MQAKKLLLKAISQEGVHHLFMVPGGLIDPFLSAFDPSIDIKPIVAAQEGGAAYMADGYARASNRFGACLCIGGPGLTNTTTAVLTAKSDNSPLFVISGEVPTTMEGIGAFQDASLAGLDDYTILQSAVIYSCTVENAQLFHHHLHKAFVEMLGPVKHPIHLCIPRDIQESEVLDDLTPLSPTFYHSSTYDQVAAQSTLEDLQYKKIAILAGEGIGTPEGAASLKKISETLAIPVATTLRAKGIFPEDHPHSLGVFGYAGTRHATDALLDPELDVLIVLGSGLNMRDSLYWTEKLNPRQQFIQVDVSHTSFSSLYKRAKYVLGDAKAYVDYLLEKAAPDASLNSSRKAWIEQIRKKPRLYDIENTTSDAVPIHPARVVTELRKVAPHNTVLFVDSGAHRAFCGHYWQSYAPGEYISATNLGPMGWAIPASIGGKLAQPSKPCCVVTGDGCMLMHGMEIHTAARYKVPVIFVVINNAALGNVYLRAEKEGAMPKELTTLPDHDWAGFARSLGLQADTVKDPSQLAAAFSKAFQANQPYLIDIKCGREYPTPVEDFNAAKKTWSYHD